MQNDPEARILTVPNVVSVLRLGLVPLFLWLLLWQDAVLWTGTVFALIGSTDWVDGFLARKLDQVTWFGTMLDPAADRVALVAALIASAVAGVLPLWFVLALLVRDVVMTVFVLKAYVQARVTVPVTWLGKTATFVLYFAVAGFFIGEGTGVDGVTYSGWILGIVGLVLYFVTAAQYVGELNRVANRR